MRVHMKYIGVTGDGFVNGQIYLVLGFVGGSSAMFLNNGQVRSYSSVTDPAVWELVSVTEGSCQQLFP
jgi:hypothetical protein